MKELIIIIIALLAVVYGVYAESYAVKMSVAENPINKCLAQCNKLYGK